jgi:hypothetical protein
VSGGVTPELLELVAKASTNLKVAHGQLREIERALASMPQAVEPAKLPCPQCGLALKSRKRLEEHLANVHAVGLEEVAMPFTGLPKQLDDVLPLPEKSMGTEI